MKNLTLVNPDEVVSNAKDARLLFCRPIVFSGFFDCRSTAHIACIVTGSPSSVVLLAINREDDIGTSITNAAEKVHSLALKMAYDEGVISEYTPIAFAEAYIYENNWHRKEKVNFLERITFGDVRWEQTDPVLSDPTWNVEKVEMSDAFRAAYDLAFHRAKETPAPIRNANDPEIPF